MNEVMKLVREWRDKATASREEAGRIRRTVKAVTEAEVNCNIRAEVWDQCADALARLAGAEGGNDDAR